MKTQQHCAIAKSPFSSISKLASWWLSVLVLTVFGAAAQAQDVDWLLNLNDAGFDPTPAGGTITYDLSVTNDGFGPNDAPASTIDVTIPANASLIGFSGGITGCSPVPATGPATVTCNVPPIAANGGVVDLSLDVRADVQGSIILSASMPTAGDKNAANNTATEITTITQGADMELNVNGPATAASGSTVTYDLVSINNGPDPVEDVIVSFPIPTGLSNVSPPSGCSLSGSTYTCTIPGPIAVGASATLSFDGQISTASGSTVTPLASITGGSIPDPNPADNTDSINTSVTGGTDVSIDKTRSPGGSLLVGDLVTFTLDAEYTGDSPTDLTITDTVPANYTIDSITTTGGWICSQIGQTVTCTLTGGSGAGSGVSLGSVDINTTVASAGTATNTADISAVGPSDANPSNNSDTDGGATIQDPTVDLAANKSGPNPPLVVANGVNVYDYDISATNLGTADFFGTLVLTDPVPAGVEIIGYSEPAGWSCSPAASPGAPLTSPDVVVCQRTYTSGSPLAAGATSTAPTLEARFSGTGPINNVMTVSSPDANIADLNPGNDSSTFTVTGSTAANSADIGVNKTALVDPVIAGQTQTFEIEVFNNDATISATTVTLTDTLTNLINNQQGAGNGLVSITAPAGFSCGSPSTSGGFGRVLECTIASLPPCTQGVDCPVVTVEITQGGNGTTSRQNTADVISADTPDPDLSNNDDTVTYAVTPRVDLELTKVGAPDPATAGQNLTYVLTARNLRNGLSRADNVIITDVLPADVTFISASGSAGPSASGCATTPIVNTTTGGGNNTIICNVGNINNGAQRTVTVVVRPNNATRGTSLINNGSVDNDFDDINPANDTASETIPVQQPAFDLLINKTDSVDPLPRDEDTVYSVTVTNLGPSSAEDVVIEDLMPTAGISYRSHTINAGGTCPSPPAVDSIGGTLTCTVPLLLPGETATVQITARGVAKGTAINNANVSTQDEITNSIVFDTNSVNNAADQQTTVRTRADVQVTSKTAVPSTVNLLDDFNFIIVVENPSGPGLAEADNVVLTDNLPTNMVLTGRPTINVTSGTIIPAASINTCTGAAGDTFFTCDLGEFSSGGVAQITVPVEVIAETASNQVFTNTASLTTDSIDPTPGNNSNSGTVTVGSSSISGTVFRDFDNDAAIDGGTDTGVDGVLMTLTGTDKDGNSITRTTTTAGGGLYTFDLLPEGNYTITRSPIMEVQLNDGTNSVGSDGGTLTSTTVTSGIALLGAVDATGYLFAVIPQASVGISKVLTVPPVVQADGSFLVPFQLVVENLSLEPLINIEVSDVLQGGSPLFGTHVTLGAPSTDPMAPGTYTINTPTAGSCGSFVGGYDGAANTVVATGFSLNPSDTCTLDIELRVQPTVPLPTPLASGAIYENQASVDAEGQLTGQNSATNPQLTDLSDDGTTPDTDGDRQGNEAGENDPTPVPVPNFNPMIALIKTANTSALSSPPLAGEQITYNFAITNTGSVNLTNVTVADTLPGINILGGPIALLAPGATDTATITATYSLTQADVDAGQVTNTATTTGTDPFGDPVTDTSGTTNTDDVPLVTPLADAPAITLVKTANASAVQDPAQLSDTIIYGFTITNTGNVTLSNVTVTDSLPGIVINGGPIASLTPGATDNITITATYQLVQSDLDAGRVSNTAIATGTPPTGPAVTDASGTDQTNDDPTIVPLSQFPQIELDKEADDSAFLVADAVPGNTIPYSFTITNTGLETLTNVTVTDILPGLVLSGNPIATLAPGAVDSTSITGLYTVTAADVAAGFVDNTATVTGDYTDSNGDPQSVNDTDSDQAVLTPIRAVPEVFPPFTTDGGTTTSMLDSDTVRNVPATLGNVTISVISTSDPAVTLDPATGLITLAPGNPAGIYTVDYEICDIANPTICDTATETVIQGVLPAIETTKTQNVIDNGDGVTGVGDTVEYTITLENTGNTDLDNVTLVDTLTTLGGTALSLTTGPTFVSADASSPEGDLLIGETATYTATFLLTIQSVTEGGLENTVTGSGTSIIPPGIPGVPTVVTDVSDDGNDTDGNTNDDPTVLVISPSLSAVGIVLEKTTPLGVVTRGSVVPYTITIRNDNAVVGGNFNVVDVLPPGFLYQPGSATLNGVPFAAIVAGRAITWPNVAVPPLTTVTATVQARVTDGANAGEHVNTASVRDPGSNTLIPPVATATVRIAPEAVFDCGDVIGKVFDDRNRDGYQNEVVGGISDDAYLGGKGKIAPAVIAPPQSEPGIPDARLVGVDGTIITTDQYGRFHVPCAMLPDDRGSNFILKLDTRSLPAGFRMTTENPRVVRLTPGKMTEMNFGAAITQVVRVDLNTNAFGPEHALKPGLEAGLDQLVTRIADTPVNLRLAYHLSKTADRDALRKAQRDMRAVERHIRALWRDVGQVKLTIERTIVRSGQ